MNKVIIMCNSYSEQFKLYRFIKEHQPGGMLISCYINYDPKNVYFFHNDSTFNKDLINNVKKLIDNKLIDYYCCCKPILTGLDKDYFLMPNRYDNNDVIVEFDDDMFNLVIK